MQWIRENLFLTCVIGALIVLVGVAYFIRSGQDTAFEAEDMAPRVRLANRIGSLSRSTPVNKAWIAKAQDRLEGIQKQRDKILLEAGDWNKKNYKVLKLKPTAGDTIDAFPYDATVYQNKGLTSQFTNEYRKVLYSTLAKIELTAWPTKAEIAKLSDSLAKDIVSRRTAARKRVDYANQRAGVVKPPPTRTRRRNDDKTPVVEAKKPEGVTDEDWGLSRLSDTDIRANATRGATEDLMLQKAKAGIMFVSPTTLAMVTDPKLPGALTGPEELTVIFPKEEWRPADAPASKLWKAQLNIWITQDILAAIDTTNKQSLQGTGTSRQPTVINSAIKLLRKITIEEKYRMVLGADGEATGLTRRITTPDYEIVEYQVGLVMKTAYLPDLMRNLMMRGDHTVTGISIEQIPPGPDGEKYYGTDPVASVTMSGEILFRSIWTRKIMPIETLRDELRTVVGPDANKRLEQEVR